MRKKPDHKHILIIKAQEDFDAANNLIKLGGFSEEIVLFHCQQAIEKALKAYLDYNSISYPKSHDLETLLSSCIKIDPSFKQIDFVTPFTTYAIDMRYDEIIEIPKKEVFRTVSKTRTALNFIIRKIKSYKAF